MASEVQRKLTAILCTDVVGYSMGEQKPRARISVKVARRFNESRRRGILTALWLFILLCMFPLASSRAEESAEELSPTEISQLLWKEGTLLHLLGEYDSAIERFSRSIEILATAEAYTYRGWSLSMVGRFEEAIADCKEAIRIDPDYGNPYNDIGVYLINLGQAEEAIPWLKKAIRAERYCCYQYPHFNLGRVLIMQGRLAEAERSLEKALSFEPAYEPARKGLEFIRSQKLKSA